MSVLKSKRTLSKHEYVRVFGELYDYTSVKLAKVPKRKQRWICEPISHQMNEIYKYIMILDSEYYNYGIKLKDKPNQSRYLVKKILRLQKHLIALWNIEKYKTKDMVHWCEIINQELQHITKLGCIQLEEHECMFILDYKSINEADFVKNMCNLHRMIYTKTMSLPEYVRNTSGSLLMELADEALYCICNANRFVPNTKSRAKYRTKNIDTAIECIKQMQQPMMSLFNIMRYSEQTMLDMSRMLNKEMRLLKGVKKSDKQRFPDF